MAISQDSFFSNAIVGVPQVATEINVYEEHLKPKHAIGTKFERQDGAVFRYVHFGATVDSAGLLCSVDVSESSTTMTPAAFVAPSSDYQVADDPNGTYPNALFSKYMLITKASVSADDYAGAYISLSSGPSATSHTYRIKSNTATGNPASGKIRLELYSRLMASINSSQSYTITGSRYANLEASLASTGTDMPSGISMIAISSAGNYGWVQTRGITGVLSGDSTILAGRMVAASTQYAGAVDLYSIDVAVQLETGDAYSMTPVHPIIGIAASDSTALTFVPVILQLE